MFSRAPGPEIAEEGWANFSNLGFIRKAGAGRYIIALPVGIDD